MLGLKCCKLKVKRNSDKPLEVLFLLMMFMPLSSIESAQDIQELPVLSSQEKKVMYKWQDKKGTWHFGDKPPENAQYRTIMRPSPAAMKWNKSKTIDVVKANPPKKGAGNQSKKNKKCNALDKKIDYYQKRIKTSRKSSTYRELKRSAQWKKLKEC